MSENDGSEKAVPSLKGAGQDTGEYGWQWEFAGPYHIRGVHITMLSANNKFNFAGTWQTIISMERWIVEEQNKDNNTSAIMVVSIEPPPPRHSPHL